MSEMKKVNPNEARPVSVQEFVDTSKEPTEVSGAKKKPARKVAKKKTAKDNS